MNENIYFTQNDIINKIYYGLFVRLTLILEHSKKQRESTN